MKKIISTLLMLSLLITSFNLSPYTYAYATQPSTWAQSAINELKATGLFEESRFVNFEKPITRQQFVYFLVKSYETMTGQEVKIDYAIRFNDTTDEYALKASTVGLTSGTAPGYFSPDATLDRKTMVAFVVKLLQKGNLELKPASAEKFSDDAKIATWAKDFIMISRANNIVSGEPNGNFNPDATATAQVAMILTNSILKESVGKTYTVDGVSNVIELKKPETAINSPPTSASGYIELKTTKTLSSNSKINSVTLSLDSGDSIESVGLYQGITPIVTDIEISGSTIKITTDSLLPLDTAYTIKAFTTNGKRYSMSIQTPPYQKFVVDKSNYYNRFEIPANPAKGFHYPYFITVSQSVLDNGNSPYEMLVETNNTGRISASNIFFYESAKYEMSYGNYLSYMSAQTNAFAVMTTFPRPEQAWEIYTHSLDRDSMLVTDTIIKESDMGNFKRLDLQLKAIMEDAEFQMESNGYKLNGKPMLHGFSASSDFANRYSLIHPETIKAVAISHGTTMPFAAHNNITLNYPMGIADLKTISGVTFDEKAYKALPQFWFRGSEDLNDGSYFFDGWDTMGETYRKAFGELITSRKAEQVKLLKAKGFTNMVFKEYSGIGHDYNQQILEDLVKFYNSVK